MSETHVFFLIGSLICDDILEYASFIGKIPVFVNCGWNGKELTKEKVQDAIFVGCRGEVTRAKLFSLGINVRDMVDPIYGLNIEDYPQEVSGSKTLFTPHISEETSFLDPLQFGCTDYLSPVIRNKQDIVKIISKIRSADFVLSGSMHIAMLAHVAGVPFALFSSKETQFIDHEIKWWDWLSVFEISPDEVQFSSDLTSGKHWHSRIRSKLEKKALKFEPSKAEAEIGFLIKFYELSQQRDELSQQRDELSQQRDELIQQRDELIQQRDELIQQRDELIQQRDELIQQRDELIQQRDELIQQRDELIQQRDELIQQRDELSQQRDELIQQRDELIQQRDELIQQRDELIQQRDELIQQRDELLDSTIWKVTKPIRSIVNLFER